MNDLQTSRLNSERGLWSQTIGKESLASQWKDWAFLHGVPMNTQNIPYGIFLIPWVGLHLIFNLPRKEHSALLSLGGMSDYRDRKGPW